MSAIGLRIGRVAAFISLAGGCLCAAASTSSSGDIDYKWLRLPNGLRVVIHEDHKAPIVAVGVWYRVGSADEPRGLSGMAHLFEHLMFYGSQHHNAPYLDAFQEAGGTGVNAATFFDHTAYYATVPRTALDRALWLESDRMGHLLGVLGQERLDSQRGVVLNERSEFRNSPYGRVQANLLRHVFPANHPYHLDPFGLAADLNRASLDHARSWFRDHYGAANATLVMAGDITTDAARSLAMTYFAHIPPGPDLTRERPWIPALDAPARGTLHDHVTQRRLVRAWPLPERGTAESRQLDIAARILADGAGSRLHRRLVDGDGTATAVGVELSTLALASVLEISVDIDKNANLAAVETALGDELRNFIEHGPSEEEVSLAKTSSDTAFLMGTETMATKARALAEGRLFHDDPAAAWRHRERPGEMSVARVHRASSDWLSRPAYTLTVLPAPEGFDAEAEDAADDARGVVEGKPATVTVSTRDLSSTPGWGVDRRNGIPPVGGFPGPSFPSLQRSPLSNGAELVLARRDGDAFTRVRVLFDSGTAADQGRLPGTANFTMSMLKQGTAGLDAAGLDAALQRLGATLDTDCDTDTCFIDLTVPRDRLAAGLSLMTDMVRHAAFRPDDIHRRRLAWLSDITVEQSDPSELVGRLMPRLLYGEGHPYAGATSGKGTRESVQSLDARALRAFRGDFLRPDNLHVLVVGDISLEACTDAMTLAMTGWTSPRTSVPRPSIDLIAPDPGEEAYLIDRPEAEQTYIGLGMLAPPATSPDATSLKLANLAFWSDPGSRLNANLRDKNGWSYGTYAALGRQRATQSLTLHAPVQTDRTADAVIEIRREIASLVARSPALTDAEIGRIRDGMVRSLPGAFERGMAVLVNLGDAVKLGRGDDFWQTLLDKLRATDAAAASGALEKVLRQGRLTWVMIGDRSRVEGPLRQQFPGLRILDPEGREVE
jgi:predicted Zn-dependent peptidase